MWSYERLLHQMGVCPENGGRYYLHSGWHLFSAMSHASIMGFIRRVEGVFTEKGIVKPTAAADRVEEVRTRKKLALVRGKGSELVFSSWITHLQFNFDGF